MSICPPNYTQIPNLLLDSMPDLTDVELRIALAICRQTFGWHRESAVMSISFLMKATGKSNRAIINGCESLVGKNVITKVAIAGYRGASAFSLNVLDSCNQFTGRAPDPCNQFTGSCENSSLVPVNSVHTNKEREKDTPKETFQRKMKIQISPQVAECRAGWIQAFEAGTGRGYHPRKTDAAACQDLLACGMTVEAIVSLAERAYGNHCKEKRFWSERATTLESFARHINEIESENSTKGQPVVDDISQEERTRLGYNDF